MKGDRSTVRKNDAWADPRRVDQQPGMEHVLEDRYNPDAIRDRDSREEAANDPSYSIQKVRTLHRHAVRKSSPQSSPQNVETHYESPLASSARFRTETGEKGVAQDIKEKTALMKSTSGAQSSGETARRLEGAGGRLANAQRAAGQVKQIAQKGKQARSLVGWGIVGFVATAYVWQFICALITLIAWGIYATIEGSKTTAWHGFATNWIFSLANSALQPDLLGWAFWGVAALITIGVFLACIISFYITGIEVNKKHPLLTPLCFTLSFLPVTNIGPWLLIWVIIVKVRSTVALIHENPAS